MSGAIRIVEKSHVVWTFTFKRGGVAENMTGATVLMYVHKDGVAAGTNVTGLDGVAFTPVNEAIGLYSFTFTTAMTTISGADVDLKGTWRAKVTTGGNAEWWDRGTFLIERNEMVA